MIRDWKETTTEIGFDVQKTHEQRSTDPDGIAVSTNHYKSHKFHMGT